MIFDPLGPGIVRHLIYAENKGKLGHFGRSRHIFHSAQAIRGMKSASTGSFSSVSVLKACAIQMTQYEAGKSFMKVGLIAQLTLPNGRKIITTLILVWGARVSSD